MGSNDTKKNHYLLSFVIHKALILLVSTCLADRIVIIILTTLSTGTT